MHFSTFVALAFTATSALAANTNTGKPKVTKVGSTNTTVTNTNGEITVNFGTNFANTSGWYIENPYFMTLCESVSIRFNGPKNVSKPFGFMKNDSNTIVAFLNNANSNDTDGIATFVPTWPLAVGDQVALQIGGIFDNGVNGWATTPYFPIVNSTTTTYGPNCSVIPDVKPPVTGMPSIVINASAVSTALNSKSTITQAVSTVATTVVNSAGATGAGASSAASKPSKRNIRRFF
ncbi:hypothetical protein T439DRAFT_355352 [Meredithblackwellia eburnea MCA 4105]